jgi:PfaB family protein
VAQAEIVVSLAYAMTHSLRSVFGLQPQYAFGNSLGELAMFASLGTWKRPIELSARIRESNLFRTILHGPMTILDDGWRSGCGSSETWEAVLATAREYDVQVAMQNQRHVFLAETHSSSQGVIAGRPQEVAAVLRACQAATTSLPFRLVYHVPVVAAVAADLEAMYTLEVGQRPSVEFLSLKPFTKVPHNSRSVAQALVNTACQRVDFPQLVENAYGQGARVFVEIGPRQNCISWVKTTLNDRPHAAVGVDQKGVDVQVSLTRAMAALLSHRVNLCTTALRDYC